MGNEMDDKLREVKMKYKPLGDRLIVKPKGKEEKSKGGIIIPDSVDEKRATSGQVMVLSEDLKLTTPIKGGDEVLYSAFAGTDLVIEKEEYLILIEDEILAVIG